MRKKGNKRKVFKRISLSDHLWWTTTNLYSSIYSFLIDTLNKIFLEYDNIGSKKFVEKPYAVKAACTVFENTVMQAYKCEKFSILIIKLKN